MDNKKCIIEYEGGYMVVHTNAEISNCVGELQGDYEDGDDKFVKLIDGEYRVCQDTKSAWILEQINNGN
jgi:hypothetical protein